MGELVVADGIVVSHDPAAARVSHACGIPS